MGDMNDDDAANAGDAWGESTDLWLSNTTPAVSISKPVKKEPAISTNKPFDDGSEPDFAGWLAAQAQKKTSSGGGSKPLPKGLAKNKSTTTTATKKPLASRPVTSKPVVAKKIDMKPKDTGGDDDGWGDGW
jgi:SCY1-like protein 1